MSLAQLTLEELTVLRLTQYEGRVDALNLTATARDATIATIQAQLNAQGQSNGTNGNYKAKVNAPECYSGKATKHRPVVFVATWLDGLENYLKLTKVANESIYQIALSVIFGRSSQG